MPADTTFDPAQFIKADSVVAARIRKSAGVKFSAAPVSPASALAALAALAAPGKERWLVKTGQDDDAGKVGKVRGKTKRVVVETSIDELNEVPRPPSMPNIKKAYKTSPRAVSAELTIWRLTALVTAIKSEDDGDLHLILQSKSGETMIAEAARPEVKFVGRDNPWLPAMKKVRDAITNKLRAELASLQLVRASTGAYIPLDAFQAGELSAAARATTIDAATALDAGLKFKSRVQPREARLAGVGFFDRVHGQMGVAPKNGIELHPILEFEWL